MKDQFIKRSLATCIRNCGGLEMAPHVNKWPLLVGAPKLANQSYYKDKL